MVNISDSMAGAFVEHIQETVKIIRSLGPNPLRVSGQTESAGES
jgi:hypothetical protein